LCLFWFYLFCVLLCQLASFFIVLLAFVVLGLVFSVLSQEIGLEEGGQKIATLFIRFWTKVCQTWGM